MPAPEAGEKQISVTRPAEGYVSGRGKLGVVRIIDEDFDSSVRLLLIHAAGSVKSYEEVSRHVQLDTVGDVPRHDALPI